MKLNAKISDKADNIGELFLVGEITDDSFWYGGVDSKDVKAALDALPNSLTQLDIHVNSCGGSVTSGTMMQSLIDAKRKKCGDCKIVTYNDGIAASMATMIMQMGEERHMAEGAMYLAHYPLMEVYGHKEEHAKAAETLEAMEKNFRAVYMRIFTGTEEELDALLKEERLITAEQAKEYGFITDIDKLGVQAEASENGISFGAYCVPNKMVASTKGLLAYKNAMMKGGENGMFTKEQMEAIKAMYGENCGEAVLTMLKTAHDCGIENADAITAVHADAEALATAKASIADLQEKLNSANVAVDTANDAVASEKAAHDADKAALDEVTDKLAKAAEKVSAYDAIRADAVANCKAAGVKAMGNAFDEKAYEHIFAGLKLDEINAIAGQFEATAAAVLNAGKHISGVAGAATEKGQNINVQDYKL